MFSIPHNLLIYNTNISVADYLVVFKTSYKGRYMVGFRIVQKLARNLIGVFRKYSESIPKVFRKYSGSIPEVLRESW